MDNILDQELAAAIAEDQADSNQRFLTAPLISNANPSAVPQANTVGTSVLDAVLQTTNALTGSNFDSRGIQQINNQILQGNQESTKLAGLDNDLLRKQIQTEEAARKSEAKAADDQLKLELKLNDEKRKDDAAARRAELDALRADNLRAKTDKLRNPVPSVSRSRTRSAAPNNSSTVNPSAISGDTKAVENKEDNRKADRFLFDLVKSQFKDTKFKDEKIRAFYNKPIIESRKRVTKIEGTATRARSVLSQLSSNKINPAALGGIATALAKAAGETGVLTDTDIARFKGSQSLKAKLTRFAAEKFNGQLPDIDRQELRDLAQSYLDLATEQKSKVAFETAQDISARFGSSAEELISRGIGRLVRATDSPEDILKKFGAQRQAAPAARAPAAPSSDEDLINELTQGTPASISADPDDALLDELGI